MIFQLLVASLSAKAASVPKLALLSTTPNTTFKKYANHFCEGNFDANNHTLWEGVCANTTCEQQCIRMKCVCWDFRSASQLCRITNYTSAVQVSHNGFDAYVDSSQPVGWSWDLFGDIFSLPIIYRSLVTFDLNLNIQCGHFQI